MSTAPKLKSQDSQPAIISPTDEVQKRAAAATLASIQEVATTEQLTHFSNRSIAEVEALQEEVSAVIPAGNIVGLVMSGLVKLRGRQLPAHQARSDVSALLRGLDMLPRHILPNTIYGTLFVGPAAVLHAYQKLLTLAGINPEDAFPDGLWQFYLEFALREDAARHSNETIGFQQALSQYNLALSSTDQLAAWVCAVAQIYFQYDDLLYNEWRERVYLYLIEQAAAEANLTHKISFKRLPQAWAAQRPYHRGSDAHHQEDYPTYRRRRFDNFLRSRLEQLPTKYRRQVEEQFNYRVGAELASYQRQLSILATLQPDQYRENRAPLALWRTRIAIVLNYRYYLIPACITDSGGHPLVFESQAPDARFYPAQLSPDKRLVDLNNQPLTVDRTGRVLAANGNQIVGYLRPISFQAVRRLVAAIAMHAGPASAAHPQLRLDDQLLSIERSEQERARKRLSHEESQHELQSLKYAPVIINWDEADADRPLAHIRQGKRGIGDHALTIFRTNRSMIFDQSHIFFDGVWGMALAEMLTGEAVSWGIYFNSLPPVQPVQAMPQWLRLEADPVLKNFGGVLIPEVAVENDEVKVKPLVALCKLMPRRHPALKLTINDLLVLYRSAFGHDYRPGDDLEKALFELKAGASAAEQTYQQINEALARAQAQNPALVIPMEASAARPRERLYPTTFRNPFTDLWDIYQDTLAALTHYQDEPGQLRWTQFTEKRRTLLAQLNYFGQLMRAYKNVAQEGGSTSTATIKLLAFLPNSLMKLLDEIPQRIDILNEVIKGEEVFSNVGRVARGSSITRFTSAKDDNDNKTLVWGVLTDDTDTMCVALRDFRPHVAALNKLGREDLSRRLAQDYLDGYVAGLNRFVENLLDILNSTATHTTKETEE